MRKWLWYVCGSALLVSSMGCALLPSEPSEAERGSFVYQKAFGTRIDFSYEDDETAELFKRTLEVRRLIDQRSLTEEDLLIIHLLLDRADKQTDGVIAKASVEQLYEATLTQLDETYRAKYFGKKPKSTAEKTVLER